MKTEGTELASPGAASSEPHAVCHPSVPTHAAPKVNDRSTSPGDTSEFKANTFTQRTCTPSASASEGSSGGGDSHHDADSHLPANHLDHLSAIAAAQHKMFTDRQRQNGTWNSELMAGAQKRTADGELKQYEGKGSPVRGHSRNTSTMSTVSTVSMASTTTSTIGDLSSDLKTRLSYAMLKVQNGWQANSLDEVESMASQAASPASSNSTVQRYNDASASPRAPLPSAAIDYPPPLGHSEGRLQPRSKSPSSHGPSPGLAPPASIQPSWGQAPNKRRHSNARHPPRLNTAGHAASPITPAHASPSLHDQLRSQEKGLYSPHQNVREQDAIETLLFMSSPGNSANMKHAFSPTGSPGPSNSTARHALPSGPRKALPMQRLSQIDKKVGFVKSPLTSQPHSPMDVDTPHASPNRAPAASRRRVNGASSHLRGALSLPSGLGASSSGSSRKMIDDAYVENMLERAAAESSDEEEIQLPPRRPAEALV